MNEAEVLYNSILFDHDYYLNSINMENENREFAVNHYLTSGWKNGFSTSILFSSREYFLLNPDVKNKNVCPLLHWEICGKNEGRRYRIEPMSKRLSDICGLNIKNVEFGGGGKILLESPIRITNLTWLVRNNQSIGAFSYFESKSLIYGIDSVGRYCSVAADVTLGGGNHGIKTLSTSPAFYNSIPLFNKYELLSDEDYACNEEAIRKSNNKKIEVSIGSDVWIGNGAKVLGGVTIGDGAVIGAGSVVTRDVPPYAVVAGVPAKILKYRFSDEIIDKLLKIKWWRFGPEITCGLPFGKIEQMIGELESRIAHWQEYYSPMFLHDLNAHTIVRSN